MFNFFSRLFETPILTRERIIAAFAVAITTDAMQILLGPLGFTFADEVLDILAMILTLRLVGFHPLLLPTFVLEVLPIIDMLPTWTGCLAIVVGIRKRQQAEMKPPSESLPTGRIIDV
jgi:hypothetical protein